MGEFWDNFPIHIFGVIPNHTKKCLERTGFDCLASIKSITTEDFAEIEELLKSDPTIITEAEKQEHFHNFAQHIPNFKFVMGHRRLFNEMAEFAKTLIANSKPTLKLVGSKKNIRGASDSPPHESPQVII